MKKTLYDIDVKDKRVFLRVDFNVPLDDAGEISDDSKIIAELPTIKYLLKNSAKVILCSHLGRPKGKVDNSLSLVVVAKKLLEYLPLTKIKFAFDCVGKEAEEKAESLKNGEVLLLENVRFHKEEEQNDPFFAKKLAKLADVYINDAYGTIHRAHASVSALARLLPNAVGMLIDKELNTILNFINEGTKPFVLILGGAKVSDKIYVVLNLLKKSDAVLIGGGMAYTFLKAKGVNVGSSLVDDEKLELAKEIMEEAEKRNIKIVLPVDHKCATTISSAAEARVIKSESIPDGLIGLDLGPKTVAIFKKYIKKAKRVLWNGPLGMYEFTNFAQGTENVAKTIVKSGAKAVVGGGDSIACMKVLGLDKQIYHISTGGGATLKVLEGVLLPGVEPIEDK